MRSCLVLTAVLVAACAQVQAPPGGPEEFPAPRLVETVPADGAVAPTFRGPVVFAFDQRLSERNLADAVTVSPRTSDPLISRRGSDVRVSLREGWRPGTIYHVTLHPVLQDLWNNPIDGPHRLVFSTGPRIPETGLTGRVIDRVDGTPERDARVEAIRMADSLVYAARSDTAGGFRIENLPEGEYLLRAYDDQNRNRQLDPFEPRDTLPATVRETEPLEVTFRLLEPDTTPPVLARAAYVDGVVEATFDDHLDPDQPLAEIDVRITGPVGRPVPIARIAVGAFPEEMAPEDERPAEIQEEMPTPEDPPPSQILRIEPADELAPGATYRVEIAGVRNLHGLIGGGEVEFTVPDPEPDEAPPGEAPGESVQGIALTGGRKPAHPAGPSAGRTHAPIALNPS